MDPVILEEYYARKRSVLFSVAQQSDAREPAVALVLSYIVAMLARDGIRIEPAGTFVLFVFGFKKVSFFFLFLLFQ
jgi:hypothetical protein